MSSNRPTKRAAGTPPYPNDALRWAAAEVRHPFVEEFSSRSDSVSAIGAHLRELFPIHEETTELTMTLGQSAPMPQPLIRQRWTGRDRFMGATVSRDAITLETTNYPGWSAFRDVLSQVLEAVAKVHVPEGILRVGLRYIDEVRVPAPITSVADWSPWISDKLMASVSIDDEALPSASTIALQYGDPPGHVTIFRAAAVRAGRTVQTDGPLRPASDTPDGPYFLLDTDASWSDPNRQVPEFGVRAALEIFEDLHTPCRRLFEASITQKFRDEVLSEAPA